MCKMDPDDEPIVEDAEDSVPTFRAIESNDDDEDIEDETLTERLIGLTEMFPGWVRSGSVSLACNTKSFVEWGYTFSRSAVWFVASTAVVLVMPVLFEVERSGVEEQQKLQQRQILLGPGAAGLSPAPVGGLSMPPPPLSPK